MKMFRISKVVVVFSLVIVTPMVLASCGGDAG